MVLAFPEKKVTHGPWWQDLMNKVKDAIRPDPGTRRSQSDQQHGAPLAPDQDDPHTSVADPADPGKAPQTPPPQAAVSR